MPAGSLYPRCPAAHEGPSSISPPELGFLVFCRHPFEGLDQALEGSPNLEDYR
jgi:hypothetical protein